MNYKKIVIPKILEVAKDMPKLGIKLSIQGELDSEEENERKIELFIGKTKGKSQFELKSNSQYTLVVTTRRKNYSKTLRAHCPRFHRAKDEGWFIVLGDLKNRQLWALKRVSGISGPKKNHYLQLNTPEISG